MDLEMGILLAESMYPEMAQDVFDMLASATVDMLLGQEFTSIETAFADSNDTSYFQEFILLGTDYLSVFMRTAQYPNHVVFYVCDKQANAGMVLTKSRMNIDSVAAAV
ncbi:hypothetical protein [Parasulfitobacter algicola]|uniref:Uncharacterized protein n=1 Tax=Parasulfitobacter algicola TaxID=2614809 RepID=A0ABX2J0K7_9RHOB|nr:hypothetical protein [Sulfitobacter algicola]NSX56691.1 hypothetical protein [Sulfitobacter algicola]